MEGNNCFKNGDLEKCKLFLEENGIESLIKVNNIGETLMHIVCKNGHLSVCKWLFEVGADITKADNDGNTPMFIACKNGHLLVCKWLYDVGAAADITKANICGSTPMSWACYNDHLSVYKWLFEVGAAADITKANKYDDTPMYLTCRRGHLSVCKWLVLNGALSFLPPVDEVVGENEFATAITPILDSLTSSISLLSSSNSPLHQFLLSFQTKLLLIGHVDKYIVKRDTLRRYRPDLLAWAQQVVATHHTFFHTVLRASVILPDSHQQVSPDQRCHLPRLPRAVLQQLGDMLGVKMGRQLRNAREFAEALAELQDSEIED